ncbi:MAG: enoyl-CoA hydratase/isomerase family protein [Thermoanaerobaculia bacterium]
MLEIQDHGPVRELRLARPPVNALIPELVDALRGAIEAAPAEGARALVISGSPGRFSGGLDVPYLMQFDRAGIARAWEGFYAMLRALATSPIPIAAAVTGHAPAGGCVISIFCDARIMAEGDFKIGLNEVQVGIPLPPVIFHALKRLIGPREAERLAVSGVLIPAAEAHRVGLVDELAAPDRVVERAVEWCNNLLALPPQAMTLTRRLARADLAALLEAGNDAEVSTVLDWWFSGETQAVLRKVVEMLTKKKG